MWIGFASPTPIVAKKFSLIYFYIYAYDFMFRKRRRDRHNRCFYHFPRTRVSKVTLTNRGNSNAIHRDQVWWSQRYGRGPNHRRSQAPESPGRQGRESGRRGFRREEPHGPAVL